MIQVFLEALPFALGGAVSPALFALAMLVMASPDRGRLKGLCYFCGTLTFSVLFVLALHFLLRSVGLAPASRTKEQAEAIIDVILGSLLVLWAIGRVLRGTPPPKQKQEDRARKQLGLGAAFSIGFVMMATNLSTLPLYALAVRAVDRSGLSTTDKLVEVAAITVIILVPAWLPVALAYLMPTRSQRILGDLRDFLSRHGRLIITGMLVGFGFYLILKGAPRLWP
jgi:threonine/homoserine/homoserine lactone efflux protein